MKNGKLDTPWLGMGLFLLFLVVLMVLHADYKPRHARAFVLPQMAPVMMPWRKVRFEQFLLCDGPDSADYVQFNIDFGVNFSNSVRRWANGMTPAFFLVDNWLSFGPRRCEIRRPLVIPSDAYGLTMTGFYLFVSNDAPYAFIVKHPDP